MAVNEPYPLGAEAWIFQENKVNSMIGEMADTRVAKI